MLIIGSTELTFTRENGSFHCPECDESREYRHRYRREFITLYFIPVIPLRNTGEFIECRQCRQVFEPNVVEMSAEEIRASRRKATMEMIRRALVVIVAADDEVSDEELAAVSRFARLHDLPEIDEQQVLREASAVQETEMDVIDYVQHVSATLREEDKELLVQHAFLAATADGELSSVREELLRSLPEATGVPEWRFRELIAAAAEQEDWE